MSVKPLTIRDTRTGDVLWQSMMMPLPSVTQHLEVHFTYAIDDQQMITTVAYTYRVDMIERADNAAYVTFLEVKVNDATVSVP